MQNADAGNAQAALKVWREGLVGLTGGSALVKFKAPKSSSVRFTGPESDKILQLLKSGSQLTIAGIADNEDEVGAETDPHADVELSSADLTVPRPHNEVHSVARNLMRKASATFLDRGLTILYVSFGLLKWRESDGAEMTSPLLLVPVELNAHGPKSTPRLSGSEDDSVINPALTLRLAEFGIALPTAEDLEDSSVTKVFDSVRDILGKYKDSREWTISDETYLATYSFQKEAMYKDLKDHEDMVLGHPIVTALATSDPRRQTTEFQFDPISPDDDIDSKVPPEEIPLVLDADSSQRVAIAAALNGESFVMDGPPGTGKSQTISNMIGALLHAKKKVLFVSEKIAALEVVRNRLSGAGLGAYLFELHSHNTARKEVAHELLSALDNVAVPPTAMPSITRAKAKDRREKLNNYASAMNEVRSPLNMTLHHVLGLYSDLPASTSAPIPDRDLLDLTEQQYSGIQDSIARLRRFWRPAAEGSTFLWTDVIEDRSLDVRLQRALDALKEIVARREPSSRLSVAFSAVALSDTPRLITILNHIQELPSTTVHYDWLSAADLQKVEQTKNELAQQLAELRRDAQKVHELTGVSWRSLPAPNQLPPKSTVPDSLEAPIEVGQLSAADLSGTAARFAQQVKTLDQARNAMNALAHTLGWRKVEMFSDVDTLEQLVRLRAQNSAPAPHWFSSEALSEARATADSLRKDVLHLNETEDNARTLFKAEALTAPLDELHDRFTNLHQGLRKLFKQYRVDKRTVAGLLNDASYLKEGIQNLSTALDWSRRVAEFDTHAALRQQVLGKHYAGRDTDFKELDKALDVVEAALSLSVEPLPRSVILYLTDRGDNSSHQLIVEAAQAEIGQWRQQLAPPPALSGRLSHQIGRIQDAIDWLSAHVAPMQCASERINAVFAKTEHVELTSDQAEQIIDLIGSVSDRSQKILDHSETYRSVLGDLFTGESTDLNVLESVITWTSKMRDLTGARLNQSQIDAIAEPVPESGIEEAFNQWIEARDDIVNAFAPPRRKELTEELNEAVSADQLLHDFVSDSVGQQEWFGYRRAYEELSEYGLAPAVDYCIKHRVGRDQAGNVINRSLLRGWSDAVINSDDRLQPLLADERQALVTEYRELDRQFFSAAISEIIVSANSQRPTNTAVGESSLIRREGSKQRRHRPVRDLISETRSVTPRIKPVFMMSPLAVSQYLPPEALFDVVIFDEASQVTPADAINCIYRGKSLILAGDDKQLPPTSFFERNVEEVDDGGTDVKDFQSVLELAKASGAFNNLGLSWHYRSRHEDLIAFSNYKFYDGKLVTFPSAQQSGNHVGVELFKIDGLYRRGGGSDNPLEATAVAERVIEHFRKRPDLSLGVVTFSVTQADAVQRAIDEIRTANRDLDQYFDVDDRLDGFFIRALEQVQGDERDVIIFSIGYGPDEAGKVSTNFGALNRDKGWRRLNVGITRARQRVEIVSSIYAGQIPPSTNENVEYFRAYLEYAEKGQKTLAIPYSSTGLNPESPFEESVLKTIQGWGYTVEPQVGAAGYRIDLGVRHPQFPGSFALAVECDGYQYHSAPSARDRDRLRDQILSGLGWTMHRIWGTAWYRDRAVEERRLRQAIEAAIERPVNGARMPRPSIDRPEITTQYVPLNQTPLWAKEYAVAVNPKLKPYWADPGDRDSLYYMIDDIHELAKTEGPVHREIAFERLRDWWGVGRIGAKIRRNIEMSVELSDVRVDGEFLMPPENSGIDVRTPGNGVIRKVEQIHLDEIAVAVRRMLDDAGALTREEVSLAVSRLFGWTRRGSNVEGRIYEAVELLVACESIADSGRKLHALGNNRSLS
ncbi:DUF3320 domain-containing protein [Brevibacterium sp. GP-SGM9]|uniref:DUF3320 domain-containing protein n=1 Tax=Brevibacterium sp. GP-SGM9 TaxID=3376990 RepID=UPI0039A5F6CB